jgi:LPXTG-motif cell wall-anchored protein
MTRAPRLLVVLAALLLALPGPAFAQDEGLDGMFGGAGGRLEDAPPGTEEARAPSPAARADAGAGAGTAPRPGAAATPLPATGAEALWVGYAGVVLLLTGIGLRLRIADAHPA